MTEKEKRPPGRPRAEEPGVPVATWLRTGEYDRLIRQAQAQEQTVSALIRDLLRLKLR